MHPVVSEKRRVTHARGDLRREATTPAEAAPPIPPHVRKKMKKSFHARRSNLRAHRPTRLLSRRTRLYTLVALEATRASCMKDARTFL